MSKVNSVKGQITLIDLLRKKERNEKISMVTCYDAAFGKLINKTDIDAVLVGDSLGNVLLGFESTVSVKMEHMVHHTAAVSKAVKKQMIVADMPFMSYHLSVEQTLKNAARLVQEGGAHAVKVEGGQSILKHIKAMVDAGIPVVGHLGFTPQSIHKIGGYKVQGRGKEREKMIEEARLLEEAGVFALVLEMVPSSVTKEISSKLKIPTIGIGAGADADGQVLVLHDLLGFDDEFSPKFLKRYANIGAIVVDSLNAYNKEVKGGEFPTEQNSYRE